MRIILTSLLLGVGIAACAAKADDSVSLDDVGLALGGGALPLRGTTLSSAEFGETHLPGNYGTDYTYPTTAEVDYFVGKGMTALRVPFRWERLQQSAKAALDATELARLDAFVTYATSRGASVILDPHNYARYFGKVVGSDVGDDVLADFWSKVALHYARNARVVFALMNEPHDLPSEQWARAAQAAIDAIRATGAANLILVPGVEWTGAHSWTESFYGTPNAQALMGISDSKNNFAFEVHQYLDSDFSGTHEACASRTIGSQSMRAFTDWLKQHGRRGFLGEFGGGSNATCFAAVEDQLAFVEANADVYLGWSWWAAGPWWGSYFLSIEPGSGGAQQMMPILERHLRFSAPPPSPPPQPSPPPPPPSTGDLVATLAITSDWASGYCADVHVKNAGHDAVPGWSVTIDAGSSTLSQAWNVTVARQGSIYTATPVDWNKVIAPGGEADWGFCANKGSDGGAAKVVRAGR